VLPLKHSLMLLVSVEEVIKPVAAAVATTVRVAAAAVAVVVSGSEAVFVEKILVIAGSAVKRAFLHISRTADISDSRGGETCRVLLVVHALGEVLLEVVAASTATIVLDVAVVVEQGAGVC